MRNRFKKMLIIGIIVGILVTILLLAFMDKGINEPSYTVLSTADNGISLLYDIFKQMGYPVGTGYQKINRHTDINDIYIVTQPDMLYLSPDDLNGMMHWAYAGGRLVCLADANLSSLEAYLVGSQYYENGHFTLYRYGLGEVLTGNASAVLNKNIMSDSSAGILLQSFVDSRQGKRIVFAEYYHGYQNGGGFMHTVQLRNLPGWFQMILCQLFLALFFLTWMLGKRFGRPISNYEEIEREENEYLLTLSAIYQNAGMGSIVLENHYNHFIRQCERFFQRHNQYVRENLVALWIEYNLPHSDILQDMICHMAYDRFHTRKRKQRKQFLQAMEQMITLTNIIQNKGR